MDILTPSQRRKSMKGNKSSGTKIEIILGKAMFAKGLRYRKNNRKIYGTPDFSFKKYKIAVFADGDFWHGKDWDKRKNKLGANAGFWFDKIERNLERDFKVNKKLKEEGWDVLRFWESDIKKNPEHIVEYVYQIFQQKKAFLEQQKLARKQALHDKKKMLLESYLENKEPSKKRKAVQYTQEFLHEKYPQEDFSLKVAEGVLKYGTSKKGR